MYLPARLFPCLEEQLINAIVFLSIFSLPLWIVIVELARRRLRAVFFQSKRPDLRTSEVKTKRNIKDYTLTNIVFDDDE